MTLIQTALLTAPADLKAFPADEALEGGGVLLLLSLGYDPGDFTEVLHSAPEKAAILLADCYGVLGTEAAGGRNREFMEKGRGQEYGGVGGRGGRGVVAVAIAGARVDGGAGTHLVIAAHGRPRPKAATCFGGVAKATWRWERQEGRFVEIPGFSVAFPGDWRIGLEVCDDGFEAALRRLQASCPEGYDPVAVALFPCYMRGINRYGRDDVEPETVTRVLPGVPIFGMFCHGELGPARGAGGFVPEREDCSQHSLVTVTALLCRPAP